MSTKQNQDQQPIVYKDSIVQDNIYTIRGLIEEKRFDEALAFVNSLIAEHELSDLYFIRAIIKDNIGRRDYLSLKGGELLPIVIEDLDRAIAIDNNEKCIKFKIELLQNNLYGSVDFDPVNTNVEMDGSLGPQEAYPTISETEWEEQRKLIDAAYNNLILHHPTAENYYALSQWDRDHELQHIEKAIELEPRDEYLRKQDRLLFYSGESQTVITRVKERLTKSQCPEDAYNLMDFLLKSGNGKDAASLAMQIIEMKMDNGYPVLLASKSLSGYLTGPFSIQFQSSNLLSRLFEINEWETYAKLVSYYYHENNNQVPIFLVAQIAQNKLFDLFLKYFPEREDDLQMVKWIRLWVSISCKGIANLDYHLKQMERKVLMNELFTEGRSTPSFCDVIEVDVKGKAKLDLGVPTDSHHKLETILSVIDYEAIEIPSFLNIMSFIFDRWSVYEAHEAGLKHYEASFNNDETMRKLKLMQLALHYLNVNPLTYLWGDESEIDKFKIEYEQAVDFVRLLTMKSALAQSLSAYILEERLNQINTAKIRERNRILSNLSHSIKNMLKSVIDPLQNLKQELPEKAYIIDNAIKGANLIREIVNSINLSFKTSFEDLEWDVIHPGKENMSLQDMILDSLIYSIGNMFDFRYFPNFAENYFPRSMPRAKYEQAQNEWSRIASGKSLESLLIFCSQFMFDLKLDLDESQDYQIGNEKSSAIKLMILFQEIIFNAVKYSSFTPLKDRKLEIALSTHDDKIQLRVSNTFSDTVRAKTTGVGKLVIENFAKVLDCEPRIHNDNGIYSIDMQFKNIWRKHAQDTLR